jgi:hypothetical protein
VSFLNEYPRISEIEDMVDFCARHETVYIYGASENCEYLAKFLNISGILAAGYVVSTLEKRNFHICALPVLSADDIPAGSNAGILLGLSEKYYEFVISILKDNGIDYCRINEHNKRNGRQKKLETVIPNCTHKERGCRMKEPLLKIVFNEKLNSVHDVIIYGAGVLYIRRVYGRK